MPTAGEGRAQARTGHCVSGQRTGDLDGVGDTTPHHTTPPQITAKEQPNPNPLGCPSGGGRSLWQSLSLGRLEQPPDRHDTDASSRALATLP